MSIWINNKLAPHSYEKTLISLRKAREEQLIVWIEGTNCTLSFSKGLDGPNPFGMVGGSINTNTGVSFTKEMLQEIVDNMKQGATLKIAACNHLITTRYNNDKTVFEEFEYDNSMRQIGDYTFQPTQDELNTTVTDNS